ncbi:hypothetical protein NECID01_0730 [Nematocida sp. AWRm77]|nr:hypothetical protein NECID01_0730 [Nematocida sp. AWRm77]
MSNALVSMSSKILAKFFKGKEDALTTEEAKSVLRLLYKCTEKEKHRKPKESQEAQEVQEVQKVQKVQESTRQEEPEQSAVLNPEQTPRELNINVLGSLGPSASGCALDLYPTYHFNIGQDSCPKIISEEGQNYSFQI